MRTLVAAELIQTARVWPEVAYVFRHALTQEVAYQGQRESERQRDAESVVGPDEHASGEHQRRCREQHGQRLGMEHRGRLHHHGTDHEEDDRLLRERRLQRLAQCGNPLGGHVGRRHEQLSDREWRKRCVDEKPIVLICHQCRRISDVAKLGAPVRSIIEESLDLLVRKPVRLNRLQGAVEDARISVDLALLHGQKGVDYTRIADDHLELGAEYLVEQPSIHGRDGVRGRGADRGYPLLEIGD